MADRWKVVEDGGVFEVQRNGAWYSTEESFEDARGLLDNQRATFVKIVWADGYTETRRL